MWLDPFDDLAHARIVSNYFRCSSANWEDVSVADGIPNDVLKYLPGLVIPPCGTTALTP